MSVSHGQGVSPNSLCRAMDCGYPSQAAEESRRVELVRCHMADTRKQHKKFTDHQDKERFFLIMKKNLELSSSLVLGFHVRGYSRSRALIGQSPDG